MDAPLCSVCRKPKAALECELCARPSCKRCAQKVKEGAFAFLSPVPADLSHRLYCGHCFDARVAPEIESYERRLRRARGMVVFMKKKAEQTRLMNRSEKIIRTSDCADRDEALLRLAFVAAEGDFNTLIDVDLVCEKVRNAGYQTSRWHATGIPTRVDALTLERLESIR